MLFYFTGWRANSLGIPQCNPGEGSGLRVRHRSFRRPGQPALHKRGSIHRHLGRSQSRTRGGKTIVSFFLLLCLFSKEHKCVIVTCLFLCLLWGCFFLCSSRKICLSFFKEWIFRFSFVLSLFDYLFMTKSFHFFLSTYRFSLLLVSFFVLSAFLS